MDICYLNNFYSENLTVYCEECDKLRQAWQNNLTVKEVSTDYSDGLYSQ